MFLILQIKQVWLQSNYFCLMKNTNYEDYFGSIAYLKLNHVKYMDGWVWAFGLFRKYFSHIGTMEGWTWKALCNEKLFRFGKNLASSRIQTRDSVIPSRKHQLLGHADASPDQKQPTLLTVSIWKHRPQNFDPYCDLSCEEKIRVHKNFYLVINELANEKWVLILATVNTAVSLCIHTVSSVFAVRTHEPAHEIMVHITSATSEDSGEPAHPRNLARAFAVRTHEVWK